MSQAISRRVALVLLFAMVVAVGGVAWAVSPRVVAATPGSATAAGAEQIGCDGVEGLQVGESDGHGDQWVPEGGTVGFTATEIEILPSTYTGPAGRGQYKLTVSVLDGGTTVWTDWGYATLGVISHSTDPPPYNWYPHDDVEFGSWSNPGGSDTFTIRTEATATYAGEDITWSLDVQVDDGNGDPVPPCPDEQDRENAGDNQAADYECPGVGQAGDPVDTRSGNLHMPVPGMGVAGRGMGLDFELAYNSVWSSELRAAGYGWSSTLDMTYNELADGSVEVVQETGATVRFRETSSLTYHAPDRLNAELEWDAPNLVVTFTRNHFEQFAFRMTDRRLISMRDRFGRTTTVHYPSGSSKADYMEDSAGRRLLFTWEGNRLKTVTDQLPGAQGGPRSMVFTYTSSKLTTLKDADGGSWVFTYDTANRMLTMRKPRHSSAAKVIENHYDSEGRVDWQEDELNRRTIFQYDVYGRDQTLIKFPDGRERFDIYEDGKREQVIYEPGTAQVVEDRYTYDPRTWACTSHTDRAGFYWRFENDANGNRTLERDPEGRVRRWEYNEFDQVEVFESGELMVSLMGPGDRTQVVATTFEYDPATHNLELVVEADGTADEAATELVYGTPSRPEDVTGVIDARGKEWSIGYDPATGYVTSETDPEGNVTGYEYNAIGWPTRITSPKGMATPGVAGDFSTTYAYDLAGRTVTVTDAEGNVSRVALDANGNVASVAEGVTGANPTGDVTLYGYDDADQLVSVNEPGPGAASFTYTAGGQRQTFTNELNGTWTYGYDTLGRLATETTPAPTSDVTRYGWDAEDRLVTVTQPVPGATCSDAKVGCITYDYDRSGLLESIDYTDPATPDVTAIGYDRHGRRISAQASALESWTWNARSQLTSFTDANGTTGYGWDGAGNLTSITYPGQSTPVVREFDDASRLIGITDWVGNETTFDYDLNSNWTSTTFPASTALTDTFGYDDADRITSAEWSQGGTAYGSETYARGVKGLIHTKTPTGIAGTAPTGYGYDTRERLTSAGTSTYAYDAASNLTTLPDGRLGVYDPSQRLCWASPTATSGTCASPAADAEVYSYDGLGNRVRVDQPDNTRTINTYDQASRLTKVAEGTTAPISTMTGTPVPGDFDGDAHDDVFWYGPGTASDHATWGDERDKFGRTSGDFTVNGTSYVPLSGDFDGDGHDDIFWYAPGTTGDTVWFWFGRETGDHTAKPFTVNGTYTPLVGDFDGDGYDDVFWYSPGTGGDPVWWGSATVDDPGTTFGLDADVVNGTFQPTTGDFDGDGKDDIYWYGPGTAADVMWWGTTTRGTWVNQTVTVNGTYAGIHAGDFDGDGKDDMFLHSTGGADPVWWGNSRASFGSTGSKNLTVAGNVTPVIGDFDGDTKDDLLAYVPGAGTDSAWWGASRTAFGTDPAHGGLAPETTTVSTYTYGASGQLLSQTTGGATTTFVWAQGAGQSQLLAQTTPAGTSYVIHGPAGRPIAQVDPGNTLSFLHTDHVGSVIAATDPTGTITSTQTWDPFGNPTASTGITQPVIGWHSRPMDPATGEVVLNGDGGYPPFYGGDGTYDPDTGGPTGDGQPGGMTSGGSTSTNPFGVPQGHRPGPSAGGGSSHAGQTDINQWLDDHGATAVTVGSVVFCFFVSSLACGVATGIAFAIRTWDAIHDDGWEAARQRILADLFLTVVFFGLGATMSGATDDVAGALWPQADDALWWLGRGMSNGWGAVATWGTSLGC